MKYPDFLKGKSIWSTLLPLSIGGFLLFSMISISLTQLFLTLAFIFWLIMLIKEKQRLIFPSFFWPLLVYAGLSLISAFFSTNPKVSLTDSRDLFLFLLVPVAYMGFSSAKVLTKVNSALLGSAYVSCLYSFFYLIFKASLKRRIPGFMGQVMTQAGLLLLFCCLALSIFLFTRSRIRYLWGLGFFFSFMALILTKTRSAWLGLIFAAALILFLYKPRTLILVPVLVGLFLLLSPKSVTWRVLTLKSFRGYRADYIKAGIKIIKDYPLLGTGANTVDAVFKDPKYGLPERAIKKVHLHNNIIQIAAERGIPALLAWLVFIVLAFSSLLKLLKNKDPTLRPFAPAALGAIMGLFTAGLFEYNFADSEITILFLYLITIPFALARIQPEESRLREMEGKAENKLKKKKVLFVSLIFVALFLAYVTWMSINLLAFKTYRSPGLKPSALEIEGVYHLHSTFSDGTKNIDEIAEMASHADLDFIILTDHGSPNRKSYASQGWKEGVLVLAGTELSVSRGHLVGLGFNLPSSRFSQKTELAVYQIIEAGGFSIISHPYSKVQWSWGEYIEYSGIDIMNADSMLRKGILLSLPYFPALLIKPDFALLKILDSPHRNLRKWDELNNQHPIYGYFSTDSHILYGSLFGLFHLHVLLESPLSEDIESAGRQVYDALREGRFYNAVHAAANAAGFRFWGEKQGKTKPMGSTFLADSPLTLHIKAPFAFAVESQLIHNGKSIYHSTEKDFAYEATEPGAYRVEIYLKERSPLGKNIPWIVSNPIFLKEDKK